MNAPESNESHWVAYGVDASSAKKLPRGPHFSAPSPARGAVTTFILAALSAVSWHLTTVSIRTSPLANESDASSRTRVPSVKPQ